MYRRHLPINTLVLVSLITYPLLARATTVTQSSAPVLYPNTTQVIDTAPLCRPSCSKGEPGRRTRFAWPYVNFTQQMLATVILEVDTKINATFTTTKYGTLIAVDGYDPTNYVSDETSFWRSVLTTTDIVVENNTPTVTLKPTIYTAPDEYITVTHVVTSPTVYENMGFLAFSATRIFERYYTNTLGSVATVCRALSPSTIGLIPTITPAGFTNPYYAPLDPEAWEKLLPRSWADCFMQTALGPEIIQIVSALTTTETRYGDYVHTQVDPITPEPTQITSALKNQLSKATPASAISRPAEITAAQPVFTSAPRVPEQASASAADQSSRPPQPDTPNEAGTSVNAGAAPVPSVLEPIINPSTTIQPRPSPVISGETAKSLARPPPVLGLDSVSSFLTPPAPSASVVVSGITLVPGAAPVTVGGTQYSLAASPSVLVVDGATSILPQQRISAAPVVIAGATLQPGAPVVIAGTTLQPGAPAITVGGAVYSFAPDSSVLVVDGSPSTISPPPTAASPVVISGTTLTPGAPAVNIEGTAYSLTPGSTALIIDGSTSIIPPPPTAASPVVIAGITLTPGAPAVNIEGTAYSLAPGSTALVIDGFTSTLSPPSTAAPPVVIAGTTLTAGAPAVTIDGTVYSLASGSTALVVDGSTTTLSPPSTAAPVVIGGITLTPGVPAVTISGTVYSLEPSSSLLVVDGATLRPQATVSPSSSAGYGSLIFSGLGGEVTASVVSSGRGSATGTRPSDTGTRLSDTGTRPSDTAVPGTGSRIHRGVGGNRVILSISVVIAFRFWA